MNVSIDYKELADADISALKELDRSERVTRVYRMTNGELTLHDKCHDIPDWKPEEKLRRVEGIRWRLSHGASVYGAFHESVLVGMAVLDHNPMESNRRMLNLDGLWVSKDYRGIGVATHLVGLVKDKAHKLGAQRLYVSATRSENTINFYTSVGFVPATEVDRDMHKREPDDIHMDMSL